MGEGRRYSRRQIPEDEELRLAQQHMGKYVSSLVDKHQAIQENPYLLEKMDELLETVHEMGDELAEVRRQNEELKALWEGALGDGTEETTLPAADGDARAPNSSTGPPPGGGRKRLFSAGNRVPVAEKACEKKKLTPVGILSNVIFYFCLLMLIVGAFTFAQSDDTEKSLFGFRYYYIKTASMVPVYPVGSIVITRVTDPADIQVGDDITVYVGDGQSDTYLTHRVVELTTDSTGELAFRTKGVNNKSNDPEPFNAKLLVGKVVFCIPMLGTIMTFVRSQLWLVIGIFILLLALSFMLRLLFSKDEEESEQAQKAPKEKPKGRTKWTPHHPKRLQENIPMEPAECEYEQGPEEDDGLDPGEDPTPSPAEDREGVSV